MITVLIDPGHGRNTRGKHSPDLRLFEYEWAREMASTVCQALRKRGVDVRVIVPELTDISIRERVRRVNEVCDHVGSRNVLLVSIHVNATGSDAVWRDASGFSVFCSKNASESSHRCARLFTEEARKRNLLGNRAVPKEMFWTWSWTLADIGILRSSRCPAVLTENFFQDTRKDVDFLLSESGKRAIRDLHVSAIMNYINSVSK